MFKLDLEKAEEPEIILATSIGSWKKQESSRKTSTSALPTTPKALTVDHSKLWKILEEMDPGDLPNPGTELASSALQVYSLSTELSGKPKK